MQLRSVSYWSTTRGERVLMLIIAGCASAFAVGLVALATSLQAAH
jgi:hypothetical protein